MKKFILAVVLLTGVSAFAQNTKEQNRIAHNKSIVSCIGAVQEFTRNVQLDQGLYYRGQNKRGSCFIGLTTAQNRNSMSVFVNSKENQRYVSSLELGTNPARTVYGMVYTLRKCDISNSSITVQSELRIPQFANGLRLPAIFDAIEKSKAEFRKDAAGRLIAVQVTSKRGGTQTCHFN